MKKYISNAFAFLAIGLLLGACEENTIEDRGVKVSSGAMLKFYPHAQDAPRVNLYLNGEKVTSIAPTTTNIPLGIAFGSIYPSNAYFNVPSGSYTMLVADTVSGSGTAVELAKTDVKLEEGTNYSAFLVGKSGSYETFIIRDETPQDYSKIHVRFMNTMVGMPFNVDVVAIRQAIVDNPTTPEDETEPEESYVLATDVGYKEYGEYVDVKPGEYKVQFKRAGTGTIYATYPTSATSVWALASLGRVYTLFLRGTYSSPIKTSSPAGVDYWRER